MGLNQSRERKSTVVHIIIVINNIYESTTEEHSRWITGAYVDPQATLEAKTFTQTREICPTRNDIFISTATIFNHELDDLI